MSCFYGWLSRLGIRNHLATSREISRVGLRYLIPYGMISVLNRPDPIFQQGHVSTLSRFPILGAVFFGAFPEPAADPPPDMPLILPSVKGVLRVVFASHLLTFFDADFLADFLGANFSASRSSRYLSNPLRVRWYVFR